MRHLKTFVFAVMIMLGMSATAFAAADTKSTDVTYHQQPTITITVPKTITVGQDKKATYTVTIRGDVYANNIVSVVPDRVVVLSDINGKTDVTATVTQETIEFLAEDINSSGGVSTQGTITADDLTAGDWEGALNFTITIKETIVEPGLYDADWNKLCSITAEELATNGETYSAYKNSCYYIVFPRDTKTIGNYKFSSFSHLTEVKLNNGLEEITAYAFAWSSLTSINIPSSMKHIQYYAFSGCNSLTNIIFADPNNWIYDDNHVLVSVTGLEDSVNACTTVKNRVTSIYHHNEMDEPGLYNIYGVKLVTLIKEDVEKDDDTWTNSTYRDYRSDTRYVVLPDDITRIGNNKFYGFNDVQGYDIPDGVTDIGTQALPGVYTSIIIPDSVTMIGKDAFEYSKLTNLVIEGSGDWVLEQQNANPWVYVNISEDQLADSANAASLWKTYHGYTGGWFRPSQPSTEPGLYDLRWQKLVILTKEDVESNDSNYTSMFSEYAEKTYYIVLPNNITRVGSYKFYNFKRVHNISIPDSVVELGAYCLANTGISTVTLPDNLERIETWALRTIRNVTIPGSVYYIENRSFPNNMTSLTFEEPTDWFIYKSNGTTVDISDESLTTSSDAATYWNNNDNVGVWYHRNPVQTEPGLYDVSWHMLTPLTKESVEADDANADSMIYRQYKDVAYYIVLPNDTQIIGAYKFYGFTKVYEVDIPDGVTEIHNNAFDTSRIMVYKIPASVQVIQSSGLYSLISQIKIIFEDTEGWYCEQSDGSGHVDIDSSLLTDPETARVWYKQYSGRIWYNN